ncbi:hypothetical protein [Undibacterium sp. RuTC16W]|uniref:hypothetical protein n=1 Tax=Undibacterium sp. RuTC16W TaxID=3413048 RepID=UPI003BF349C7
MSKHLLYLTNNQLTATIWHGGSLSVGQSFDNYASGWQKFAEYIKAFRDIPLLVLTDLVEEDFQRESMPHVYGSARKNLIERRLTNLYRDTPYREARFQGRDKSGRKDDQMLFSALTNPKLLKPWIDTLIKEKIDIVGIYSLALLKPLLFKQLNMGKAPALLVTHQSSGLRQSFFQDGYLRFSRLAPETAWSAQSIAEVAASEIVKTRQFLASTRLIMRDTELSIVVVTDKDILQYLQPLCPDVDGMQHRFIDLTEAGKLFKFSHFEEATLADPLFLQLLGHKRIASHYATLEQSKVHQLWQLRTAFNIFSVLSVGAGSLMALENGLDAMQAANLARQAQQDTRETLKKYQNTLTSMPVTTANPHDMKAAVDVQQMIRQNGPSLTLMLGSIAEALNAVPEIKVHELNWQTSLPEATDQGAAAVAPVELATLNASLLGVPVKAIEIVLLDAEVTPFKNDYRDALSRIDVFIAELKKNSHLQIEVVKPAIDIRTSVKLESQAGNDAELTKPRFNLKLLWKP